VGVGANDELGAFGRQGKSVRAASKNTINVHHARADTIHIHASGSWSGFKTVIPAISAGFA